MSLTVPAYSYNPWDGVYSPWQLDFQKVAPEDNPTEQDNRITTNPVNQIATVPDKLIITDQDKRAARVALFALSMASLRSPTIGYLICGSVDWFKYMSSVHSLLNGNHNKARAWLNFTLAVVSVVGIMLKHPIIGLGVAAGQEAILNGYALQSSLGTGDLRLALENSLFLANNSLYVAALFYCSLEIVFISLVIHTLVQGYKAYGEFKKGNNLEGFAHLCMGLARVQQIHSLWDILSVKWLIKADVEIWKEELSPHENEIKEKLGMGYLYFKKGDKREKFLILSAQSDYNGALKPDNRSTFLNDTEKLNERFDVKFRTISRVEDIKAEIELAAQTGKVTGLLLRAHGDPDQMTFGSDIGTGVLRKYTFSKRLFSKLDPECIIGLFSCSTAKDHHSIAYEIAYESQRVTYAPDSLPNYMQLSSLNPLAWQFFDQNFVEQTKIIIPDQRT